MYSFLALVFQTRLLLVALYNLLPSHRQLRSMGIWLCWAGAHQRWRCIVVQDLDQWELWFQVQLWCQKSKSFSSHTPTSSLTVHQRNSSFCLLNQQQKQEQISLKGAETKSKELVHSWWIKPGLAENSGMLSESNYRVLEIENRQHVFH